MNFPEATAGPFYAYERNLADARSTIDELQKRIGELEAALESHRQRLGYAEDRARQKSIGMYAALRRAEAAEQALTAERQRREWQKIEDAPTDRFILLVNAKGELASARWRTAEGSNNPIMHACARDGAWIVFGSASRPSLHHRGRE